MVRTAPNSGSGVGIAELLTGERPLIAGDTSVDLEDYVTEIFTGGFPAMRGLGARALRADLDGYLAQVVGQDELLVGRDAGPSIPRDGTLLGALFESMVGLSLRVYAQATEARVGHLRTERGEREVHRDQR